jgi:hypothetical protein
MGSIKAFTLWFPRERLTHARTTYRKAGGEAGAGRYTDIWARRGGRWVCVAAHVGRG